MNESEACRVAIDIGGTFTDLVLNRDGDVQRLAKVPSTPPDYSRGVVDALSRVLEDFREMALLVHGTTAQLNAFLERKGAKTALLTTRGFGDVYAMGRGSRDRMYDLHYRNAQPLVPRHRVFEVDERMSAKGQVLRRLDEGQVRGVIPRLRAQGIESVAICFLHSYVNPIHERIAVEVLEEVAPDLFVSPSHRVCREWREYERTSTVVLNAYVSPILDRYLKNLREELSGRGYGNRIYLMQSNGGLIDTEMASSRGVLTLMSGPVGGSVGSLALSAQIGEENLICADMGGTSFDVSLVVGGKAAVTSERRLGGLPVLAPMVDIHTIGAGGGSVAWNDSGSLRVGPRSAGADPGPACYDRKGAEPTVTDANLVLGRIDPDGFLGGRMRLSRERAESAIDGLAKDFRLSREEMAEGIVSVVNAQMANAIRSVTVAKGIDPRRFALVAFGGAGPMHAPFIASELGIDRIVVPRAAGAFSAWGMLTTDLRHDSSQTFVVALEELDRSTLETSFARLEEGLRNLLISERVPAGDMRFRRSLDMRYRGQEYFINVTIPEGVWSAPLLKRLFDEQYERTYGHKNLAEEVETVNLRVEGRGSLGSRKPAVIDFFADSSSPEERAPRRGRTFFEGEPRDTLFIERKSLSASDVLDGPAIVEETSATTVVPPGFHLRLDGFGNLRVERKEASR
jgi:N-methylhydantoinase A